MLRRIVRPKTRSRKNTSLMPFVSFAARFEARLQKSTYRESGVINGENDRDRPHDTGCEARTLEDRKEILPPQEAAEGAERAAREELEIRLLAPVEDESREEGRLALDPRRVRGARPAPDEHTPVGRDQAGFDRRGYDGVSSEAHPDLLSAQIAAMLSSRVVVFLAAGPVPTA